MKGNFRIALLVGITLLLAIGAFVFMRPHGTAVGPPAAVKGEPSYWYDPMRPSEHFDKPGKSPFMDMQLVPKYADGYAEEGAGGASGGITVDSRVVQNLGVRLANVEKSSFALIVDAVGVVGVDEHRIEAIQVRQPGWVERLDVRAVGDSVRRGQRLAGVYSPDLFATQQELLIARGSDDPQLIEAAQRRLAFFGLSAGQISQVEKSGVAARLVDYYAPFDGYVMELGVRQGAAVRPVQRCFSWQT